MKRRGFIGTVLAALLPWRKTDLAPAALPAVEAPVCMTRGLQKWIHLETETVATDFGTVTLLRNRFLDAQRDMEATIMHGAEDSQA